MARPRTNPPTQADLRISEIIKDNELDGVSGLSNAIGVPADTIRKWGQRDSIPKDAAARMALRFGYLVEWVLTGRHPKKIEDGLELPAFLRRGEATPPLREDVVSPLIEAANQRDSGPGDNFVQAQGRSNRGAIPEVDVRGGMGGGGIAMALNHTDAHGNTTAIDDVKAQWELPPEYLAHELRVNAAQARIIEVQGDSMDPTLRPGDRVMVHLGDRRPSPPGVFAVWDGFGVVVKRIETIPNSDPPTLRLISDNDRHGAYERTLDEVNIIGRVVWFARRM